MVDMQTPLSAARALHPVARGNSRHTPRVATSDSHPMYSKHLVLPPPGSTTEFVRPFPRIRGVAPG